MPHPVLYQISLLLRPLSIDFTEKLDLDYSPLPQRFHRFPRWPQLEDGPVVIYVDYRIAPENRDRDLFLLRQKTRCD